MRNWVSRCTETHVDCLPPSSLSVHALESLGKSEQWNTPLPTRVIDVGPPDGSQSPFLRITNGESGKYAALSHFWGKTNHFTTTIATLAARVAGFAMEMLPKTFRDAIFIAPPLRCSALMD